MKVENVELVRLPPHPIEHPQMIDERVLDLAVEPQSFLAGGLQASRGPRIPAREQCHLVSAPDQLVRQIGDDPFGAAIVSRRAAFVERGYLRAFRYLEHPL